MLSWLEHTRTIFITCWWWNSVEVSLSSSWWSSTLSYRRAWLELFPNRWHDKSVGLQPVTMFRYLLQSLTCTVWPLSMEISRESLREVAEPPNFTSVPPPVVSVKPKHPDRSAPPVQVVRPKVSKEDLINQIHSGPVVEAMSPSVAESIRYQWKKIIRKV